MYDLDIWGGEEKKSSAQLLGKLAREVQRHSSEAGVTKKLIEIVGEELKYQAKVIPVHKVPLHPNYNTNTEVNELRMY